MNDNMVISLKDLEKPKVEMPLPPPPPAPKLPPKPKRNGGFFKKAAPIVTVVVLGAGCGAGFFTVTRSFFAPPAQTASVAQTQKAPPSAIPHDDEQTIIEEVGKLMLLPQGETPTLARVSNVQALQSEEFFKNAAIDDVVLMYTQAQKAILYRPSENKIIEVAPIASSSAASSQ